MKPLIGLNVEFDDSPPPAKAYILADYIKSVVEAGGTPVLLPPVPQKDIKDLVSRLDGLILIGGPDYCPSNYGEEPHESVDMMAAARDCFDRQLITEALKNPDLPILGVCAGAQLLNFVLGGSLIQDIKSELPDSKVQHSNNKNPHVNGHNFHEVKIDENSQLAKLYKAARVKVPTSHHQAIRKLGKGLKATAFCDDGIIEAVELPSRSFTIGVQWHPERDFPTSKGLFEELVRHAQQFAGKTSRKPNALSAR